MKENKIITLANGITTLRIIFTVLMIILMKKSCYLEAFFFFALAGVSDFFDGLAARVRNEQSLLGSYLDPFADKFLVLASLFLLHNSNDMSNIVPIWFSVLILVRESLLVLASVILYFIYGKTAIVAPTLTSKVNTALLFALFSLIFGSHLSSTQYPTILPPFLVVNTVFAIISTAQYAIISIRKIQTETY